MRAEQWSKVRELFYIVRDLPVAQRGRKLDERCADDAELRREVEHLLACSEELEDVPDRPLPLPQLPALVGAGVEPGSQIDGFKVLRTLAEGGMATVYVAEQERPRRTVALKLMRANLESASARRRFQYETEVLARLQHPGIATLHAAGVLRREIGGQVFEQPYFAMEFVEKARDVCQFVREERLPLHERLQLFLEICAAVQHGHQKGVLHRDLKPANLLVDSSGRPLVIDYGIARPVDPRAEPDPRTESGQILGTLQSMSPEQLSGDAANIDTRSDVYGLACVLFEMLEEARPFDVRGMGLGTAVRYLEQSLAPPLRRAPRELSWIVQKGLAKRQDQRYGSVSEFAEDVQRFLRHEPVRACAPSGIYHVRKFVQRNRMLIAATSVVLGTLAAALWWSEIARRRAQGASIAEAAMRLQAEKIAGEKVVASRIATTMHDFFVEGFSAVSSADTPVIQILRNAESLASRTFAQDESLLCWSRAVLGKVYLSIGETERGRALLTEAQASIGLLENSGSRVWADVQLAWMMVLLLEQRFQEADAVCDQLEPFFANPQLYSRDTYANLLSRRGTLLVELGDLERAESCYRRSYEMYREHGFLALRDTWLTGMAWASTRFDQGDAGAAEATFREVIADSAGRFAADDRLYLFLNLRFGKLLARTDRLDEGIELLTKAQGQFRSATLADQLAAQVDLARALVDRADPETGDLARAEALLKTAIESSENVTDPPLSVASAQNKALEGYVAWGRIAVAEEVPSLAFELCAAAEDLVESGGFVDTPFPARIAVIRALAQVLEDDAETGAETFLQAMNPENSRSALALEEREAWRSSFLQILEERGYAEVARTLADRHAESAADGARSTSIRHP